MTGSPMWKEFESGDSILPKLARFVVLVGGVLVLLFTGILDLTWPQQLVLGLLTVLLAISKYFGDEPEDDSLSA